MPQAGRTTFTRIRLKGGTGSYILAPVLTTTQRDALTPAEGMVIFNSTTDQLEEYDGATWQAVGQVVLDTHAADYGLHTDTIVKAADETIDTSATLHNDDELLLALAASEVWFVEVFLYVIGKAAEDFTMKFTAPYEAVGTHGSYMRNPEESAFGTQFNVALSDDVLTLVRFQLLILNPTAAGHLQLQWSQQVSGATDLTVKANSFMRATQLV